MNPCAARSFLIMSFRPSSKLHSLDSLHLPQAVHDSIFISENEMTSESTPCSRITRAHSCMSCAVLPSALGLPLIKSTFAMVYLLRVSKRHHTITSERHTPDAGQPLPQGEGVASPKLSGLQTYPSPKLSGESRIWFSGFLVSPTL